MRIQLNATTWPLLFRSPNILKIIRSAWSANNTTKHDIGDITQTSTALLRPYISS